MKINRKTPKLPTSVSEILMPDLYSGIENCVGRIGYPVGVAGPIDFGRGEVFVPLCTLESCLIASINRGFKIFGDCEIHFEFDNRYITRAPGFLFKTSHNADLFVEFVAQYQPQIIKVFEEKSLHLKFVDLQIFKEECSVFLRFVGDSDLAMGMNLITSAVNDVVKSLIAVESPVQIVDWVLSSNLCADKKIADINIQNGRGYFVKCCVELGSEVLDKYKISIETLKNIYNLKYKVGSRLAGIKNPNGQIANVISALYIAFGQDCGHIPESSEGFFDMKLSNDSVHFELTLYNLIFGLIGGGTDLPHVAEFIKMTKCESKDDFARLTGATVLAAEISLFFSLCEHTLAEVHNLAKAHKTNEIRDL